MKKTYILLVLLMLIAGVSTASAGQDKIIDISHRHISDAQYTKVSNGIKFDNNVNAVSHFKIEKNNKRVVKISLTDETTEVSTQTIGVPLTELKGFKEYLQVRHFDNTGKNDYTQIIKPILINDVAYVDVVFTSVTIEPYTSHVLNSGFESWTLGTSTPDNWTLSQMGGGQSDIAKFGNHSFMISDDGGEIYQPTTITPGNYTVGYWLKVTGTSTGIAFVNMQGGTPDVSTTGAPWTGNTDWMWVEHREYINSANPNLYISASDTTSGARYYFDEVILSPDNSIGADEHVSGTKFYQNFTYIPTEVYPSSTFVSWFDSTNISWYAISAVTVHIDGVQRTAWLASHQVYFDTSGLSAQAHTVEIVVSQLPNINFSANVTSGTPPLTVQFTDLTDADPTVWLWDFGDGNTSTAQNPTHTYYIDDVYNVTLTATNSIGGDTYTKVGYITAFYVVPTASFTSLKTAAYTHRFTDTSTGGVTTYLWDFGDGNTSAAASPTHNYATNGTFTVNLSVTNPAGSDNFSQNITLNAQLGNSVISTADGGLVMLDVDEAHSFNFTSNITLDYTQFMLNSIPMNVSGNELIYAFTEGGMFYNVTATGYSGDGIPSNTVTWRVQVRREMADVAEKIVPFDETNYNNFKNNFTKFDSTNMSTNAVAPFTDLIGRSFYLILFVLPFVLLWQKQQRMTIPATLALITGCLFIGFIPDQYRDFITYAIILSFAVNLYFMGRERI